MTMGQVWVTRTWPKNYVCGYPNLKTQSGLKIMPVTDTYPYFMPKDIQTWPESEREREREQ